MTVLTKYPDGYIFVMTESKICMTYLISFSSPHSLPYSRCCKWAMIVNGSQKSEVWYYLSQLADFTVCSVESIACSSYNFQRNPLSLWNNLNRAEQNAIRGLKNNRFPICIYFLFSVLINNKKIEKGAEHKDNRRYIHYEKEGKKEHKKCKNITKMIGEL